MNKQLLVHAAKDHFMCIINDLAKVPREAERRNVFNFMMNYKYNNLYLRRLYEYCLSKM